MNRVPQLILVSLVAVACLGAGVRALQQSRLEARRALMTLEQKKQERDWLARRTPGLSAENEAAISAELVAANRFVDELGATLRSGASGPWNSPAPAGSIEAFFEVVDFVEQLRSQAGAAEVEIKRGEYFGFSRYAHEGPEAEQLSRVNRQRLATQYLVGVLLESRPRALLAVRRERPAGEARRDSPEGGADFFEPAPALSLRRPGEVETEAFRLEFTGRTAVLRDFLNRLAVGPEAVAVCNLEVEPLAESGPISAAAVPTTETGPVPLVRPTQAKFEVTIEFARQAIVPVPIIP